MYRGRIAETDSDEMSVSIETTPRVTTVDDTVRRPGREDVAPSAVLGVFVKEMYTDHSVRNTPKIVYRLPVPVARTLRVSDS